MQFNDYTSVDLRDLANLIENLKYSLVFIRDYKVFRIHRTYLRVELPSVTVPNNTAFRWLNWVGQILVSNVELEIGGQRIDKHYGDWLHIWNELTQTAGHQLGYANLVGNIPSLTMPLKNTSGASATVNGQTLWIPLEFWFARNPGLKC
jgi:hypothetical protein